MKDLDPKSLIIGILATALLFACADTDKTLPSLVSEAKAATGVNDKWDDKQEWTVKTAFFRQQHDGDTGWEPFAMLRDDTVCLRRRIK